MKTWQEILDGARSYMRNSPLTNQRLTEILQNTYQKLLDESDWNDKKFPLTLKIDSSVAQGTSFKLPTNFSEIEDGTGQIDGELTFNEMSAIEIMEADDVLFYADANNRDDEKAYFTTETRTEQGVDNQYLVFQYGKVPSKSISFVWKARAEKITDSILDKKPKYIHPDFHDILVYALAMDVFIGKTLDNTETASYRLLQTKYDERLSQYQYFNNQ